MTTKKTVKVQQTGSTMRRDDVQRQTLIGLGLNKIGRVSELPDTPSTRGMIAKVHHLVRVLDEQGGSLNTAEVLLDAESDVRKVRISERSPKRLNERANAVLKVREMSNKSQEKDYYSS